MKLNRKHTRIQFVIAPSFGEVQDEPLGKTFGDNVRRLRIDQRLTISCLSNITSIGRPLITKIERGTSDVRLSYVKRLADALCVSPTELLQPHENDD